MSDFFTFYTNITGMQNPFKAFGLFHFMFLFITLLAILFCYRWWKHTDDAKQRKFQIGMAIYFLIEECIYTVWLFLNCHDNVWTQVLPLELCSICIYMNVAAVFTKGKYFRFFSGVVGIVAGIVAMVYPANISTLYPALSYRVINFYMLHGAIVLFALLQLKDVRLLQYRLMLQNYIGICVMFTVSFLVNLGIGSQYMFVGVPPKIGFIASLYKITGTVFFLPAMLFILFVLQFIIVYLLRKILHVTRIEDTRISFRF